MKDTHKSKVLAITGMASVPFVMQNVAADAEGHVITEDGLIALVEAVEAGETAQAALTQLQTTHEDLIRQDAANSTALEKANNQIATLQANIEKLEKQSGRFSAAFSEKDNDGTNDATAYKTGADAELEQILGK